MKTRQGFVSNSSSSSFLIYGVCIEEDEAIKLAEKLTKENFEEPWEAREAIDYKTNFETYCPYDEIFIGKSWDSIKDDETGKQFKDSIEKELKELGITDGFSTHEYAWRDG